MLSLTVAWCAGAQGGSDQAGLAHGALNHADQARQAIARQDRDAAHRHLDQAAANLAALEKQGAPRLVPMYTEIDKTSTYSPVKKGDSEVFTADRMKKKTTVRHVEGEYTSISLDVPAARRNLEAARAALNSADTAAADTALAAMQNSVVRKTIASHFPLLKARENLALARAKIQEGKAKDAAYPLRAAAEALREYEKMPGAAHLADAARVRDEIDAYARTVKDRHTDAPERIDEWSRELGGWFDPATK
jgi:hypothetical protein